MIEKNNKYDLSLVKPRPKGWIRFLHTADWHWGFSGTSSRFNEYKSLKINDTTPEGFNKRMLDVKHAMEQIPAIAIDCDADFVCNAGDSWDTWGLRRSYFNNVYTNVIHAIVDNGKEYIEVIGNHDLPSEITMGVHLSSIRRIPGVHAVYEGFERIVLDRYDTMIHAVPSPMDPSFIHDMLLEVSPVDGMVNVGMAHTGVTTIPHYAHNTNGVVVELDQLIRCKMDYFALGDFHTPKDLGHGIHYSGSIERFGFDEIGNRPQVKIVDINPDTKELIVTPVFLDVRPMIDLPILDARGLSIESLNKNIVDTIKSVDLTDKIVRFKIQYLETDKKPFIDFRHAKELYQDALYFEFTYPDKIDKLKEVKIELQKMGSLLDVWDRFAKAYECDPELKEAFEKEGRQGLEVAIDELTIS